MIGDGTPWTPFLKGSLAARATESISAIAADIETSLTAPGSGVGDPVASALLFAYLASVNQDEHWADLAERCHGLALTTGLEQRRGLGLYGGLGAVGWMDQHLMSLVFESDDESESDVDRVFLTHLRQTPWRGHYDLISGLVGIAVYALERATHASAQECLHLVLDRLADMAEEKDGGITWHTPYELVGDFATRAKHPLGWYNLGVAHGVPGVIALLALMVEIGFERAKARPMLEGAVRWVLAQRLHDKSHFIFPSFVAPNSQLGGSRCAWCYGDPGVAMALLLAARASKSLELEHIAADLALRALTLPFEQTLVKDAGLCHGTAGLAQISLRLFRMTLLPAFEESATLWLERTLAMRRPGEGIGGYLSWAVSRSSDGALSVNEHEWQSDSGFLTGAAGIALALLAATSDLEPKWDRLLLLS